MKKVLQFAAVVASATLSSFSAQAQPAMVTAEKSSAHFSSALQYEQVLGQTKDDFYGATMKSVADKVWYSRPIGVMPASLTAYYIVTNSGWRRYNAPVLLLPAFTPVTFVNKSEDKAATEWSLRATMQTSKPYLSTEVNNGNLTVVAGGGARQPYELPVLTKGTTEYFYADEAPEIAKYPSYMLVDTLCDMGYEEYPSGIPILQGWDGSDYVVGTRSDRIDFNQDGKNETVYLDGFHQFCPKPIVPIAINRVCFPITSFSGNFFEGFEGLTFNIYKVKRTASGSKTFGDLIFTAEVNDDNFAQAPGVLVVGKQAHLLIYLTDDEKGFMTFDDEFAIELKGFQREGVDVGTRTIMRMNHAMESPDVSPLMYRDYVNKTGDYVGSSVYANNNMGVVVSFYGFYEVMKVDPEYKTIEVSANGTDCTAAATVYTQLNWNQNTTPYHYSLEGLPEWVKEVKVDSINKGISQVQVLCDALPAGVTSRSCEVKLKSMAGNLSTDVITITQGQGGSPAIVGDVNGDGKVDVADVNIIIDIILGNATVDQYPAADVTGDGKVDVADVNAVIDIILAA